MLQIPQEKPGIQEILSSLAVNSETNVRITIEIVLQALAS
jgi:hypothetical protein